MGKISTKKLCVSRKYEDVTKHSRIKTLYHSSLKMAYDKTAMTLHKL